ncbi:lck-interacting transmembrane adapter 1 isoform X1 [Pelobates fuscus]|uniref:lck-interacting transmembrane adapter 1 isoform X1 n=1 Tax=Pelobates fuscus TaxID=191477 RepID=UPI002FE4AEE5
MALGRVQKASSGFSFPGFCAAIGLFFLLWALCTVCKKRKKRRMQNIFTTRAPIVDVSLLRQTQLRSLSKSDTKLHEIQRTQPGNPQLRPVSMDPVWMWQRPPCATPSDATYSNLLYNTKPQHTGLYERVNTPSELEGSRCPPSENAVTDEYACVRKLKKGGDTSAPPHVTHPCPINRPDGLKIEDMYSKVHKKKKSEDNINVCRSTGNVPGKNTRSSEHISPPKVLAMQAEENLYESICEMSSHANGLEQDITEF